MSMLTITKTQEENKLIAKISGRVDTSTAPQFDNEVSLSLDGIDDLVLDFKQVEYISSAGLRVLVALQKTMVAKKGKLTVCGMSDDILDIFKATGLTDFLEITK